MEQTSQARITRLRFPNWRKNRLHLPVLIRLTFCILPRALSAILTCPVRTPLALGLKDICIVQLFPTARPLPQLFRSRKSPLSLMLEILSLALPKFESSTVFRELVLPAVSAPKPKTVGSTVGAGVLKYTKTRGALEAEV
jgi:hypothetical protein